MPLLQVKKMSHRFGGLQAVKDYHLTMDSGRIIGLIGPNGAGKTTIFNLIAGVYRPDEGQVILDGSDVAGWKPHAIASRGLGRTFQNLCLWRHVSVLDHVKLARYSRISYGLRGAFFGTPARRKEEKEIEEKAYSLLEMTGISHFAQQGVRNLPYGAQRRVELARALAMEPRVLLLDEPTAGMNPEELEEMMAIIRRVHKTFKPAVFLIEHRLRVVMELCERIQTLVFGRVIAEGTPFEIQNNPEVVKAYLGEEVEG